MVGVDFDGLGVSTAGAEAIEKRLRTTHHVRQFPSHEVIRKEKE